MNEVTTCQRFQPVEVAVVDAVHVAGIPARVVEGGATPAVRKHQRPNAAVRDLPDLVQIGKDVLELRASLVHQALVIRPSALLPARITGELPIEMGGVVAEDVA